MYKKSLSIITIGVVLLTSLISIISITTTPDLQTQAEEEQTLLCGQNTYWSFDNGTLTITGSGEIYGYTDSSETPWNNYRDSIYSIIITSGVTYIGAYDFAEMINLESVYLPDTVTAIDESAFSNSSDNIYFNDEAYDYAKEYGYTLPVSDSDTDEEDESQENSSVDLDYEVLTDNTEEILDEAIGGVNDTETNTAEEVATDARGNIIIVPYAGVAADQDLPDGELLTASTEDSTENTEETVQTSVTVMTRTKGEMSEDKITWSFQDGTLTISGSGNMTDYQDITKIPWFSKRQDITAVEVTGDVTSIGKYSFSQCENLKTVTLSSKIYAISAYAFYNCPKLETITVPSSVLTIDDYAIGYVYDSQNLAEKVKSGFVIYGEKDSEAQSYALKNGISFVERIQKNELVLTESENKKGLSFTYKLILVTTISVISAFAVGISFYIWQKKGGLDKLIKNSKDVQN